MASETVEGVLNTLKDMGFNEQKATKALTLTGWKGVEPAMEWLLAHPDDDGVLNDEDLASAPPKSEDSGPTEPKRILTEEEKAEQLKKLEELRIKKRAEREEREKREAIEREKKRVEDGKAMYQIRDQLQRDEMKKIAEERRREKLETQRAKDRVKAQIEADRQARREREAEARGESLPAAPAAPVPKVVPSGEKRNYDETRIQIRLPDGSTLRQTFQSKEPLSAVRLFVSLNRKDGGQVGDVRLMTSFPKRVFEEMDYEEPLDSLQLVPSAVLMVMKN